MIEAYLVYLILIIVLFLFAKQTVRVTNKNDISLLTPSVFISIIFFSFIIGSRYMVGVDYKGYFDIYQDGPYSFWINQVEIGFRVIMTGLMKINAHYTWFFIISTFLQIVFFYKAFDKTILFLLPIATITFIITEIGSLENGIRQFLALMIFFYALTFIKKEKPFNYILLITIACLFHKSAILCFPFYWILKHDLVKKTWLQYVIIISTVILTPIVIKYFLYFFGNIINILNYSHYLTRIQNDDALSTGIGYAITWSTNLVLVGFSNTLKKEYKDSNFTLYWNLFFIGLCLTPITIAIPILYRVNWYFYKFRFLILAFFLHYLSKNNKNNKFYPLLLILFWSLLFVFFIYEIYQGANMMSPFYFFWQYRDVPFI